MKLRIDIPSGHHDDCIWQRRDLPREQSRKRRSAPWLDHQAVARICKPHRLSCLGIADPQSLRLPLAQDSKGDRRHAGGLQSIENGRRGVRGGGVAGGGGAKQET